MCMLEALCTYVRTYVRKFVAKYSFNTYVHMWFHKLHIYIYSEIILLICPNLIRMYVVCMCVVRYVRT